MSMSTPTKRRKTEGYKGSQQPVGSLDFFFKKTHEDHGVSTVKDGQNHRKTTDEPSKLDECEDKPPLTDEELARKLQKEWDKEGNGDGELRDKWGNGPTPQKSYGIKVFSSSDQGSEVHVAADRLKTDCDTQNHTPIAKDALPKTTLSLQSTAQTEDTVSSTVPFDENPLTFDPAKYLPDLQKYWSTLGGKASYGILTRCFVLVNSTQSRIKIVDTLVNFLRIMIEGDPESLLPAVKQSMPMT